MSGAVMDAAPETRLFEPAGSTLEDIVLGAWEDLAARGSARVPGVRRRARARGLQYPAGPSSSSAGTIPFAS